LVYLVYKLRGILTREADSLPEIPYQAFLSLVSVITQLGIIGITIGASLSLASTTSFMNRADDETMSAVQRSSQIFAWAASTLGVAMALSFTTQLLMTPPSISATLNRVRPPLTLQDVVWRLQLGCR
jgi:uncharacterized membrane protein